jgi:hypothetical protein
MATSNKDDITQHDDKERDRGAKGGPSTGLGIPDNKHGISHPYNEDLQTQIAAKSKGKKTDNQNNKA